MYMPILCVPATQTVFNATGHQSYQITSTHLRGAVTETPNLSVNTERRNHRGWISLMCCTLKPHGQPKAGLLHLKVQMVKSEVAQTLLYQYATWTSLKGHYNKLRTAHRRISLQILGAWCKSPNNRILLDKCALQRTECEYVVATVSTRRLLLFGALYYMRDHRLHQRVMSEELENVGEPAPGGGEAGGGRRNGRGLSGICHHGGLEYYRIRPWGLVHHIM